MDIRRYANRKLYDTITRAYVTLDEIARAVQRGEAVRVTDHATGEDLTTATLLQVVLDQERRMDEPQGRLLPQRILTHLIRGRERTRQTLNGALSAALDPEGFADAEIRRRVERLVAQGALPQPEAERWLALLVTPRAVPDTASPDDIRALDDQVARLEAELAALETELAELEARRR